MPSENSSPEFNIDFFGRATSSYDEGWYLDFKQNYYQLDIEKSRCKFLRHLIAFANTAARTQKTCYIIFGVDDKVHTKIYDLSDDYPGSKKPKNWNDPSLSISYKQVDLIQHRLTECAKDYIDPVTPDFTLEYGYYQDHFVSYLQIFPKNVSSPFKLKKKIDSFTKGTVFVRHNADSVKLPRTEVPYLKEAIHDIAYLPKTDWENLIKFNKTGSFLETHQLTPSFELLVRNRQTTALNEIKELLSKGKQKILVKAPAGFGKTTLLKKLTYDLVSDNDPQFDNKNYGESSLESISSQNSNAGIYVKDLEVVPSIAIPIFTHLRRSIESKSSFEKQVLAEIGKIIDNSSITSLSSLLKIPGSRWVFLLDGIDELKFPNKSGVYLESWLSGIPNNVQIVISSRPQAVQGWNEFDIIELLELSEDVVFSVLNYHSDREFNTNTEKEKFTNTLRSLIDKNDDLLHVITSPRALDGFINLLFPRATPYKSEIDRESPEIIDKTFPTFESIRNQPVPIVDADEILQLGNQYEDQSEEALHEDEANDQFYISIPEKANIIKGIVDYIIEQEKQRQRTFGINSHILSDDARTDLDTIAWKFDWTKTKFDKSIAVDKRYITSKNLQWIERISLVERVGFDQYQFRCQLLKEYFAAEYGFRKSITVVKDKFMEFHKYTVSKNIINLLNQLRISEGQETYNIQGGLDVNQ